MNPGQATYMYGAASPEIVARSKKIHAICQRYRVPIAAVAIQFPLAHPAVVAVIPGAKSPCEPMQNYDFLHTPVPNEIWKELKEDSLIENDAPVPK